MQILRFFFLQEQKDRAIEERMRQRGDEVNPLKMFDSPDFDYSDDDVKGAASGKKRKPKSGGRGGSPPKRVRGML